MVKLPSTRMVAPSLIFTFFRLLFLPITSVPFISKREAVFKLTSFFTVQEPHNNKEPDTLKLLNLLAPLYARSWFVLTFILELPLYADSSAHLLTKLSSGLLRLIICNPSLPEAAKI